MARNRDNSAAARNWAVDPALRLLVCPVCHQGFEGAPESLVCMGCGRRYLIVDGIPVLLAARAT